LSLGARAEQGHADIVIRAGAWTSPRFRRQQNTTAGDGRGSQKTTSIKSLSGFPIVQDFMLPPQRSLFSFQDGTLSTRNTSVFQTSRRRYFLDSFR
jgi:hypothetical protein